MNENLAPSVPRQRKTRRRWPRALAISGAASLGAVVALWIAIHRYDWLGPLVANTLRALVGPDTVAKLEDLVYAIEDRANRILKRDEAPKAYWKVPEARVSAPPPSLSSPPPAGSAPTEPELPPFRPRDPGPAHKKWSAEGDGIWVPIVDPRRPDEQPYMFKTLLHPDVTRGWAEVFVVAVDLRRVDVHVMAGRHEPKPENEKSVAGYERPAKIPEHHQEELLAAFNGGFMTEHGGWGMKVDGVTLVSPKPNGCTLALFEDGSKRIATWKHLADMEPRMQWYRQAPECMYENGKIHPGLTAGSQRKWGATLDGDTVIRRSAVGLGEDRQILYVAITNHTTARVLADGMRHAGAVDVAQMDVNWSYPKFVLFEPKEPGGPRKAVALASGFEFSEDEYIRSRARRDFFYLVRKSPNAR
ncbi:MAG TPA: hypothetical protein VIM73_12535 [Polyangiaceae bacterium]